jgi:hypothetical protein
MYCWASDQVDTGGRSLTSWRVFFSDAYSQAVAIAEGALPSRRATKLWNELNRFYPDWTSSCVPSSDQKYSCDANSFVAVAAMVMGDASQAQRWLTASARQWAGAANPWPWTIVDAGNCALVAAWISTATTANLVRAGTTPKA